MHLVVMRMKLVKMTLCLCLSLMTLCGCRATHDQVLVTCYPLQYLVEQIAQDRVSCVLLSENTLIQRAQIRDDYQELLAQSDALLYLGGLESYYEAYADEITDSGIEQVNLVDQLGNFPFLRYGENNETQPWYAGDAFDDVDMYYSDPTLWMDAVTMCGSQPASAITSVSVIRPMPRRLRIITMRWRSRSPGWMPAISSCGKSRSASRS